MSKTLSYVLVTPYTVAKSRTGGVLARLLSRSDLELVGAQMIACDQSFVDQYEEKLRRYNTPNDVTLLADYVEHEMGPSGGRKHRTLLLLFRGEDPCEKLVSICGHILHFAQEADIENMTGETIRDTYADLITSVDNPSEVRYFEPAVLTPRNQAQADEDLALFADFLKDQENIVRNFDYPDPSVIEDTLVMIKPDNWEHPSSKPGTIIDIFSRTGLRIVGVKVQRFSLNQALEFYGPVEGALRKKLAPSYGSKAKNLLEKEWNMQLSADAEKILSDSVGAEYARDQFYQIINYMSGTRPDVCKAQDADKPGNVQCLVLIYEGANAISKIRTVLGSTDPSKAADGTVRKEFGHDFMENSAHASDSKESFEREAGIVKIHENNIRQLILSYQK
jgi:nucleoside diphosphate kinase